MANAFVASNTLSLRGLGTMRNSTRSRLFDIIRSIFCNDEIDDYIEKGWRQPIKKKNPKLFLSIIPFLGITMHDDRLIENDVKMGKRSVPFFFFFFFFCRKYLSHLGSVFARSSFIPQQRYLLSWESTSSFIIIKGTRRASIHYLYLYYIPIAGTTESWSSPSNKV